MGKGKRDKGTTKCEDTKLLYKRSSNSIHSRTCSGASQLTRSGILQIKKNLSHHTEYYIQGGRIKRDLSIETDICVLRRYFKHKRKLSNRGAKSGKSRFSNYTPFDAIEEFHNDTGSGDNVQNPDIINRNVDITSLIVENFKYLLNNWISEHMNKNDTKQKIENVFKTVLHHVESKKVVTRSSSCTTYILDKDGGQREVKDQKINASVDCLCNYCNPQFTSSHTNEDEMHENFYSPQSIPIIYRKFKMISTLSIPRKFHKNTSFHKRRTNKKLKMKNGNYKNVVLSLSKPCEVFGNTSSFDLLAISTKSLMKRCTNYVRPTSKKSVRDDKKRSVYVLPEPSYKSATISTTSLEVGTQKIQIKETYVKNAEEKKNFAQRPLVIQPILLNSIYGRKPKIVVNDKQINVNFKNNIQKNDDSTMTDNSFLNERKFDNVAPTEKLDKFVSNAEFHIENECLDRVTRSTILNEKDQSDPMITIDFNPSRRFISATSQKYNLAAHYSKNENRYKGRKKSAILKKIRKKRKSACFRAAPLTPKFEKIRHKDFTYLYKKVTKQIHQKNDFLKHFQDIFNYFANYKCDKNISLDVHVNVFPVADGERDEESVNKKLVPREVRTSPTLVYNLERMTSRMHTQRHTERVPFKESTSSSLTNSCKPEIIPLLDGAASHAKYMLIRENSMAKFQDYVKKFNMTDRSTTTTDLAIAQEIGELKSAIKDLAVTAEKLINDHFVRKKRYKESIINAEVTTSPNNFSEIKSINRINLQNTQQQPKFPSKAVQISSRFKNQPFTGLKLEKEPKKLYTFESENRLKKKSTSYRIIESESILKVTDMTSARIDFGKEGITDQALTCSLPQSRSLFEVSTGKSRDILTYYCDRTFTKPKKLLYVTPCPSSQYPIETKKKKKSKKKKQCAQCESCDSNLNQPSKISLVNKQRTESSAYALPLSIQDSDRFTVTCFGCKREYSCHSLEVPDKSHIFKIEQRRKTTVVEGLAYWMSIIIPIVIILVFFYIKVYKPYIHKPKKMSDMVDDNAVPIGVQRAQLAPSANPIFPSFNSGNSSFYVRLSDLGF